MDYAALKQHLESFPEPLTLVERTIRLRETRTPVSPDTPRGIHELRDLLDSFGDVQRAHFMRCATEVALQYVPAHASFAARLRGQRDALERWLEGDDEARAPLPNAAWIRDIVGASNAAIWIQSWGLGALASPIHGLRPWTSMHDEDLTGLAAHGVDPYAEMAGPPIERGFYRAWWAECMRRLPFKDVRSCELERFVPGDNCLVAAEEDSSR